MPELPEVETMRRGIAQVAGSRLTSVILLPCERKPIRFLPSSSAFEKRAAGQVISMVDRLGKRVVLRLASGDAIVIEPRMTGLVLTADPPTKEHLRVRFDLKGGATKRFWFWDRRGLGGVLLVDAKELARLENGEKLGPDALKISVHDFRARLSATKRAIKVALLDQKLLAGVGNLYASELLHLSGVHPGKACNRIDKDAWSRMHEAMISILQLAIENEGSTLADGTYRNVLNADGGFQNLHRVYDKEGKHCPTCRTGVIARVVQAQRATFYCPKCQRGRFAGAKKG
jgi:formamidopyrimidine-DNA glycosylase